MLSHPVTLPNRPVSAGDLREYHSPRHAVQGKSLRALAEEHALLWAQWIGAAIQPGSFEKDCLKEAAHHGRMAARYEQEARAA